MEKNMSKVDFQSLLFKNIYIYTDEREQGFLNRSFMDLLSQDAKYVPIMYIIKPFNIRGFMYFSDIENTFNFVGTKINPNEPYGKDLFLENPKFLTDNDYCYYQKAKLNKSYVCI